MLNAKGIHAGYGRVPVVLGASITVRPGEVVGLFGANGAGKTTFLKALAGFVRPTQGQITLDESPLTLGKPQKNAARGVRMVLEGHRVFPELTVEQNLKLAAFTVSGPPSFAERRERALDLFPILRDKLKQDASDLSGGQQQLLAMAQATIGNPRILLCDEPSLGIAQVLIPEILGSLRTLAQAGCGVLVVEQAVDTTLSYVDRVAVMDRGRIVLDGDAGRFRHDSTPLKEVILGNATVMS